MSDKDIAIRELRQLTGGCQMPVRVPFERVLEMVWRTEAQFVTTDSFGSHFWIVDLGSAEIYILQASRNYYTGEDTSTISVPSRVDYRRGWWKGYTLFRGASPLTASRGTVIERISPNGERSIVAQDVGPYNVRSLCYRLAIEWEEQHPGAKVAALP